jgi:hypothetical protein
LVAEPDRNRSKGSPYDRRRAALVALVMSALAPLTVTPVAAGADNLDLLQLVAKRNGLE